MTPVHSVAVRFEGSFGPRHLGAPLVCPTWRSSAKTPCRLEVPCGVEQAGQLSCKGADMADDGAAAASEGKRPAVFVTVEELRPGTSGHNLAVKVVNSKVVLQRALPDGRNARQMRIAECIVGDATGVIVFTARNEQVDLMKEGSTVNLRNAKIDMFKGSMRLAVDKWGRIEPTTPATFKVKEDNNLSLVEYELVNVVDE